jgi:hypothetical protein
MSHFYNILHDLLSSYWYLCLPHALHFINIMVYYRAWTTLRLSGSFPVAGIQSLYIKILIMSPIFNIVGPVAQSV